MEPLLLPVRVHHHVGARAPRAHDWGGGGCAAGGLGLAARVVRRAHSCARMPTHAALPCCVSRRYLNDHQRSAFYESLGLNTTEFNQHVILETNKSTERIFPAVPDVESPEFFQKMDELVVLNAKVRIHEAHVLCVLLCVLCPLKPGGGGGGLQPYWSVVAGLCSFACVPAACNRQQQQQHRPSNCHLPCPTPRAQVSDIGRTDAPDALKTLQRVPIIAKMVGIMLAIFFMPPKDVGSYDLAENKSQLVY